HLVLALISLAVLVLAGTILTLAGQTSNQKLMPRESADSHNGKGKRSLLNYLNTRRSIAGAMRLIELLAAVIAANQLMAMVDNWTTTDFNWFSIVMIIVVYLIFGRAIPRAITSRTMDEDRLG